MKQLKSTNPTWLLLMTLMMGWLVSGKVNAQQQPTTAFGGAVIRQNVVPPPYFRHYEDIRRYNAAPNGIGTRHSTFHPFPERKRMRTGPLQRRTIVSYSDGSVSTTGKTATKVKTVVVSQTSCPVSTYNSCGSRVCKQMTVTIYKDIYSDGRTRIWQHVAYG